MWTKKRGMSPRHGLTILEMILMMALVAILAVAAVPALQRSDARRMRLSAEGALKTIARAIENHESEYGYFSGPGSAMLDAIESKGFLHQSELPQNFKYCVYNSSGVYKLPDGTDASFHYYLFALVPRKGHENAAFCDSTGWPVIAADIPYRCSFYIGASTDQLGQSNRHELPLTGSCW